MDIIDLPDKVAFKNELGHDVVWDGLDAWSDSTTEQKNAFFEAYEQVKWNGNNYFHTDGNLYQGSTLMRVIRRKADGALFGYSFWEGGGKYGETYVECNGDEHGFESKYDWQDGVEQDEEWWVFLPVEYAPLPAYRFKKDEE